MYSVFPSVQMHFGSFALSSGNYARHRVRACSNQTGRKNNAAANGKLIVELAESCIRELAIIRWPLAVHLPQDKQFHPSMQVDSINASVAAMVWPDGSNLMILKMFHQQEHDRVRWIFLNTFTAGNMYEGPWLAVIIIVYKPRKNDCKMKQVFAEHWEETEIWQSV